MGLSGRVVLFYPRTGVPVNRAPLSLLALAPVLEKAGYEVEIVDARLDDDFEHTIRKLSRSALCIGVSSMTGFQIRDGLAASAAAKEQGAFVVWGGFHPTLLPEQTVSHPLVDAVVRGQGELTLLELVQRLEKGDELKGLLGLSYKYGREVQHNPERLLEDVNKFPPLAYHLINVEKYCVKDEASDKTLDYITSRGCVHRCAFCAISRFYGRKWFPLSSRRVVEELKSLVWRYRIKGVRFQDDNFFVDRRRVVEICRGIVEEGLDIGWSASCRCDYVAGFSDELMGWISRSGCRSLLLGAESGSPRILELIKKDITVSDILRSAEKCKKFGIVPEYSFMVGFPGETYGDVYMTIRVMEKLREINPESHLSLFIYTPYPGTPLYEFSLKHGLREPRSLEEWAFFSYDVAVSPWLTKEYGEMLEELCFITWLVHHPSLKHKVSKKSLGVLLEALGKIESIRWKTRFLKLPLEPRIIKWLRKYEKLVR